MKRAFVWRYVAVAMLFCLVCVIYLGRLFYIQISGNEPQYSGGGTKRIESVEAVRGQIYDRNGVPLVTNRYSYDLTLLASSFSNLSAVRSNEICLKLLASLESCDETDKHTEKYFPFAGAYPYYSWSEEIERGDTVPYYRLKRVLGDLKLKEDAPVQTLVDYYVKTYDLLSTDPAGNRRFDDGEIDALIRLRYDMDAQRFGTQDYCVAKDVSTTLMTYVKEQGLSGVTFAVQAQRVYEFPGYASHILGTVGPIYEEEWLYYKELGYNMSDIVGKTGCEYAFESYLHGVDGVIEIEEDSAGNVIGITTKSAAVAGKDIYLTIDIQLQIAAEDGLAENVEYVVDRANGVSTLGSGCNAGAAVAMDPDTFEVLAIASYPTYDLTTYNEVYDELASQDGSPLLNRALNGSYEPGSTYKLGVAVAGMMEGVIDVGDTLYCNGTYTRYSDYQPKCSTVASHRGFLGIIRAIADSCNCFFYELGYQLGIYNMNEYMRAFGFGESTGLELGGAKGILAGPEYRQTVHAERWTEGNTLQAAIGQSDNQATPLQLACYLSTISNGGTRYNAHLLKSVRGIGESEPSYETEPTVISEIEIPQGVLDAVQQGMRDMIESHSLASRSFASVPVKVGGKTGTAQTSKDSENALFVCAAPYDDPQIVLSVVLEQGHMGEYASITAARILEAYYGVDAD